MSPADHVRLTEIVTALTHAAAEALAAGDAAGPAPLEGAVAAAAAIDRPGGGAIATGGSLGLIGRENAPSAQEPPAPAPVTEDTLFDMASVTKVVTALTAAVLLEDGVLDPEEPVAAHMDSPDPRITPRHLLTHTAGLPATLPLWRVPGSREDRIAAATGCRLESEPGTAFTYSCIGFILLGELLETLTGAPLPDLARSLVLDPAGASTARWGAEPFAATLSPALAERAACTEIQDDPPRGLVQGATHDETAWSLGRAGNAGLFASLADALAIGRVLAGRCPALPLPPAVRSLLITDQLPPAVRTGGRWRQSLGLRIGHETETGLAQQVVWHSGFTGTMIQADPRGGTVAVLLTNRVHPHRSLFTLEAARRGLASAAFGSGEAAQR
ncbi:serine hydrolase domain-containing protein [Brachybacterium hainanense]|uniref:Serine hydrolase domain-containing protein n=1 Tax=Brachybacterium hainanense TaxID=1541174 RepID=A0ABV6R9F2_9MICO